MSDFTNPWGARHPGHLSYPSESRLMIGDPASSNWLNATIKSLEGRDPVDSLNDLEQLLLLQNLRLREAAYCTPRVAHSARSYDILKSVIINSREFTCDYKTLFDVFEQLSPSDAKDCADLMAILMFQRLAEDLS